MQLIANQLELSGGTRRDRSECLVDAELTIPPPIIQKRGALYILTETETMAAGNPRPGDIDLCREAQDIILHEFYNSNLSATITSALRSALEKANQAIFNHNSAVLPPERRGLGITVALVRNNELYLAQLPPTQAYLAHQGEIHHLPSPTDPTLKRPSGPRPTQARTGTDAQTTISMPRSQSLPTLGRYISIEPNFNRYLFESGDVLILCSAQFAQALTQPQVEDILLEQESRGALLNLSEFARNNGISDGYAMTIGVRASATGPYAPHRTEGSIRGTAEGVAGAFSLLASRFKSGRAEEVPDDEEVGAVQFERKETTPARRDSRKYDDWQDAIFTAPDPSASPELDPSDPLAPLINNSRENDPWLRRETDNLNRPAYLKSRPSVPNSDPDMTGQAADSESEATAYTDRAGSTFRVSNTPPEAPTAGFAGLEDDAAVPAWGTPRPAKKAGWSWPQKPSAQARLEATPPPSPYFDVAGKTDYGAAPRRQRVSLKGKTNLLIMVGIGIAVAVAVLLLILSFSSGKIGGNSERSIEFTRKAEQKRVTAQQIAATEPARARSLITQAQTDLEAARKEKPDLGDIQTMQRALKTTLDNINRVVIPTDLRLVQDISSQGTGVRLTKAVFSANYDTLYLLDTGRGAVYSTDLAGTVNVLLKSGDKSGNATFGKPVTLISRPDGVMVIDNGNLLWLYNKTSRTWTAQTLGGSGGWGGRTIQQAASYQGNLYLLGPTSGQILKYNAGAYLNVPEEWLNSNLTSSTNLDTAAGFSIDGTIYTLGKDGKVLQLARPNGKNKGEVIQQFDLKQGDLLGPPLSGPVLLNVGTLDFPYFFVLDGEKRVLQFRKEDGEFVQQYQVSTGRNEFDSLQDLALDTSNKKLYLVGLQKIYAFNLTETGSSPSSPAATPQANLTPGGSNNVVVITGNPSPRP